MAASKLTLQGGYQQRQQSNESMTYVKSTQDIHVTSSATYKHVM